MKDVLRIQIAVKVITKENDFNYYYEKEDTTFYSICYLKQSRNTIKPYDTDAFVKDDIYYLSFFFKLHLSSSPPKLSFGLHIFDGTKDIEPIIKIVDISAYTKDGRIDFSL